MDFWSTLLVLFRRWYLTVPAFVLSLAMAGAVFELTPSHWVSTSVLVLSSPKNGGDITVDQRKQPNRNPLLIYDRGLSETAAILIQILGSPEIGQRIGASPGGSTQVQVGNGSTNPELLDNGRPFIYIQVDSTSQSIAFSTNARLVQEAKRVLDERQHALGAPPATFITLSTAVPPTTPVVQRKGKKRAAVAFMAFSVIVTLTLAYGGESYAQHRRRRREAIEDEPPTPRRRPAPEPEPAGGH
ncbi:hypothetical protein [Actinomadura rupiterrae]|uniref:hypothetical protein n=1 Tax=Actinomadura rupiterrae TaxID=559627 RepID=UPI0020A39401|nr:hypothetical protein [Actinomadura rupiterrae]MCP2338071.1 hypothetical protein [Actinomadura rupiterrae]